MRYIFFCIALLFVASCTVPSQYQDTTIPINSGTDNTQESKNQSHEIIVTQVSGEANEQGKTTAQNPDILTGSTQNIYCLLDECIPENMNIETIGNAFVAQKESGEEEMTKRIYYEYNPIEHTFIWEKEEFMSVNKIQIFPLSDGYIKISKDSGCGFGEVQQEIWSKNQEKIQTLKGIQYDSVSLGNITYTPSYSGSMTTVPSFEEPMKQTKEVDTLFANEAELRTFLAQEIREKNILAYEYMVRFQDHPNMYIFYTTDDIDFENLVYLYPFSDTETRNIFEIKDTTLIKSIIKSFQERMLGYALFEIQDNDEIQITDENIPDFTIFEAQDMDFEGYKILYRANTNIAVRMLAEMCKPVVYYYGDENQKNTLTLNTKKGDTFTKLIPEFNSENGWNFISKNNKILVDTNEYDYLYYSLLATNYSHNRNGWIVQGKDIVFFFEDKLPKIGFNQQEQLDFIEYWKNIYQNEKYYFISFKYTDELETIIELDFEKQPGQIFRVLLDSYELETIKPYQKKYLYSRDNTDVFDTFLIKKFERNNANSTVFEWGGVLQTYQKTYIK